MDNDDRIIFEEVSTDNGLNWGSFVNKDEPKEKEYDTLFDELKDKCNPSNFKDVALDKFNIANDIYAQLMQMNSASVDDDVLRGLRNEAIDKLGVHFSTAKLYKKMTEYIDPSNFTDRQPYDKELVAISGDLYTKIQNSKNDIRELESIDSSPEAARLRNELFDTERKYFESVSACEYLNKYPDGLYAEEAKFFIACSCLAYLKHYPTGRYVDEAKKEKRLDNAIWVSLGVMCIIIIISLYCLC